MSINKTIYQRFQPQFVPPAGKVEKGWWFIFSDDKMLVKPLDDKIIIPSNADLDRLNLRIMDSQYLGILDGYHCYTAELPKNIVLPESMALWELRSLMGNLAEEIFLIAGRALQILSWHRNSKYCGRCGSLTENKQEHRAKSCSQCGMINYPPVTPAIIVAVVKEGEILLAHGSKFPPNLYSVIAGFVEPGETFEDCVFREVKEETGIEVKNIKYFGSQPWPFPHTVMVAFTAEYDRGQIEVDQNEVTHAAWFSADKLPNLPHGGSIARKLVDWFTKKYS